MAYLNFPRSLPHYEAINELGSAFLGLQLYQLLAQINIQGDDLLRERGLSIPSRLASTLIFLKRHGPSSVTEIGRYLGMSHQLAAHRVKSLKQLKFIGEKKDVKDLRKTLLHLTKAGTREVGLLELLCEEVEQAYQGLFEEIGVNLFQALIDTKAALARKPLSARTQT